jgi:hypothetical protein
MKKLILLGVLVIVLIGLAVVIIRISSPEDTWLCQNGQWVKHGQPQLPPPTENCGSGEQSLGQDPRSATYLIEGQAVTLKNGQAEQTTTPGAMAKTTTKIFEANTTGDFNGDGLEDTLVILTQENAGSGIFYYVATALQTKNGYKGTNAILLGDRIAPQPSQFQDKTIIVNYAERKPNEPMTTQPSVGVSRWFIVANNTLVEIEANSLINVFSPLPQQTIKGTVEITGQARGSWFFEASFPIKIVDDKNNELAAGIATAQSDWMTEDFVPFTASLVLPATNASRGFVVFHKDNPSGLPANDDSFSVPVKFTAEELMNVQVFFGNTNDGGADCNQVHASSRSIAKTKEVARAALEQLLLGPTAAEKQLGIFTSINPGVKIQSLTITGGLAKVDFDKTLEEAVGGSCRVAAIRSQITQTLKQFPTIKNVLISIEGRTEDILQP